MPKKTKVAKQHRGSVTDSINRSLQELKEAVNDRPVKLQYVYQITKS